MTMATVPRNRPGLWVGLFLASAGVIAALKLTEAIDPTTAFVLFAISMILLVPMIRAMRAAGPAGVGASSAAIRYTKRIGISSALYVLGLGIAITIDRKLELSTALALAIAMLPVLPIFGMIWSMGRYLVEEQDEYLRHRAAMASLAGLGLLLGAASFWGFLETFGIVPHAQGWWAMPIWAIGMGLAQGWMSHRDRAGGES
ncbi:MAG: hypothetical protein GW859_06735 [Sphingomonadales bacterium]|nr:hypothetical protein [Sphingomonadales bacterium]